MQKGAQYYAMRGIWEQKRSLYVGIGLTAIAGFLLGHFLFPTTSTLIKTDDCNKRYALLRSDLDCTTANEDFQRVAKIQDSLNVYIERARASSKASRVSVFFRDLSSRRWAAVEKSQEYAPGSLLKLPLAIAYYKLAEVEPQVLEQPFIYTPSAIDENSIENFKPITKLVPGNSYTVEQLIEHMIKYSDNEATVLLNASIDQRFSKKVFSDFGVHIPASGGGEVNFLTIENYASILRALYLGSYLNIDNSQKLLTLLTQTSFTQGIASGIPDGTPVAHKFGERTVIDKDTGQEISAELHDCGIIYKKDSPYILCVMTEGKSYNDLALIISGISKLTFENE